MYDERVSSSQNKGSAYQNIFLNFTTWNFILIVLFFDDKNLLMRVICCHWFLHVKCLIFIVNIHNWWIHRDKCSPDMNRAEKIANNDNPSVTLGKCQKHSFLISTFASALSLEISFARIYHEACCRSILWKNLESLLSVKEIDCIEDKKSVESKVNRTNENMSIFA